MICDTKKDFFLHSNLITKEKNMKTQIRLMYNCILINRSHAYYFEKAGEMSNFHNKS